MELLPKKGIGDLRFGMKREAVSQLLGQADRTYKDEDLNEIWLFNDLRLGLTFYEDEDFRFGYLVSTNPVVTLGDNALIGLSAADAIASLQPKFKTWESNWEEGVCHHFNEDNWLLLIEEFGRVSRIELGASIERDEFVWAV